MMGQPGYGEEEQEEGPGAEEMHAILGGKEIAAPEAARREGVGAVKSLARGDARATAPRYKVFEIEIPDEEGSPSGTGECRDSHTADNR
jgi:hypothetical protein